MSVAHADFGAAVDAYRQALNAFVKGDGGPVLEHFSRRDDVTLANPLGPPRVGRADVEQAVEAAAANFEDGSLQFEDLSRYVTAVLGYVVYLEHAEVRLAGSDEMVPSTLRVTMIFRPRGRHLEGRPQARRPNHHGSTDQHDPDSSPATDRNVTTPARRWEMLTTNHNRRARRRLAGFVLSSLVWVVACSDDDSGAATASLDTTGAAAMTILDEVCGLGEEVIGRTLETEAGRSVPDDRIRKLGAAGVPDVCAAVCRLPTGRSDDRVARWWSCRAPTVRSGGRR